MVEAGDIPDPFGVGVLHRVGKCLGLSPEESLAFVKDLQARGIVRVVDLNEGRRPCEGAIELPKLYRWERCKKRRGD